MKKNIVVFILLLCAVLFSGCGVSQEKLAEQGIYTELYSPGLLAERIEDAVLTDELSFQVMYYGNIDDLEDLADMTWDMGYVNNRYVDYIEADYEEFKGYVVADYTVHTMEGDMLKGMPRDGDKLAVYTADFDGVDLCLTDMMERRADRARYLVKSSLAEEEMYDTINEILYDYQNKSYAYPYMVSSLSWTVTAYGDVTELELDPEYRPGAKGLSELPRVSSIEEYIDTVSGMWNQNYGSDAEVIMENLPLTEDEIFAALMIAEANAALMPCEAGEVSYLQYSGYDDKYVLSAGLSVPFEEQDMAPMQEELYAEVDRIAQEIMAENEDQEERYRAAYEAVTEAAEYDDDIAEATEEETVTDDMRILRSAYGALVEGSTVCTGYAKAYKAICDAMGLECMMINGFQDDVGHAWNMVTLDGATYYVDCTYGDTGGGSKYCLFTEEKLRDWDYVIDQEYSIYGLA